MRPDRSCAPRTRGDDPKMDMYRIDKYACPRTRGDDPNEGMVNTGGNVCSPHMWG